MCVISYLPAGITTTENYLQNAVASNPDGFGWAVRTNDKIITGRTMDPQRGIDRFMELRSRHMGHDATFHARITTHGTTELSNVHPFRVADERTVLFHNGTLPINVAKGDHRSDTRIFAEDRLPHMGLEALDSKKRRKGLEKWMGWSKMVIMTTRSDMKNTAYILNEDDGHWNDGAWWSNSSYLTHPKYAYTARAVFGKESERDDEYARWWAENFNTPIKPFDEGVQCINPECGITWTSDSEANEKGVCQSCWRCLDCGYDQQGCFCYDSTWRRSPHVRWAR